MANVQIIIRGKKVTSATMKGFATTKAKALDALGDWANAAAAHAILNNQADWLNNMMKACQTASGKPSADSRRVVAYIKAHTKGLQYSITDGWTISKKEERRQLSEVLADGQTFKLTLAQFEAVEKEEKPPAPKKAITGNQLLLRMAAIMDSLDAGVKLASGEGTTLGTAEEIREMAKDFYLLVESAITKAAASAEAVDTDKAAQLAAIKPTSKEKAAPKAKAKAKA